MEGLIFGEGLSTEGNLRFKIDWARHSLIVGRKFAVFALSVTFYLWANFQVQTPRGGLYSEGRFNGGFFTLRVYGGHIHGGAFFSEFYGNVSPHVRENGFRKIFACRIQDPALWNPKSH